MRKHVAVKLLYQNDAADAYRMQSANLHWLELYWLKGFQRYWKRHCRFSNGPKLRVLHIELGSIIYIFSLILVGLKYQNASFLIKKLAECAEED